MLPIFNISLIGRVDARRHARSERALRRDRDVLKNRDFLFNIDKRCASRHSYHGHWTIIDVISKCVIGHDLGKFLQHHSPNRPTAFICAGLLSVMFTSDL